ncbi:MAG: glycosyltransferase, partial [Butyrivibrio sp.]|nr:glycosyltransferase [Butyrivibrio sp.]
ALISIIVPVYNAEKYLRECLISICSQKNIKSEIILVDDGSTDASGIICDEFAQKYTNIKVIHQENAGPGVARNAGLDVMAGEYLCFVDSDDYIADDMYETLLKAIRQTDSDIACCSYMRVIDGKVTAAEKPVTDAVILSGKEIIRSLMLDKEMTYSPCDKLFRACLFKEVRFPKENLPSEDFPCLYSVLKSAGKVVYIGEAKYYYRLMMTSRSQKTFQHQKIYVLLYTQEICNDVMKNMPDLQDEALFSMIQCASSVYAQLKRDGKEKECKEERVYMEKLIWKNRWGILKNPYLPRNAKLVALSIPMQCYGALMKLRKCLKED